MYARMRDELPTAIPSAKRGVSLYGDALASAVLHKVGLAKQRVQLDLIDRRPYSAIGQKLLEVTPRVIRNAYAAQFALEV